jgi:hypothetical protein
VPFWQFYGGDVYLDLTITVSILDGDRPQPNDDLSRRFSRGSRATASAIGSKVDFGHPTRMPEHGPEKWIPVFGNNHAPAKRWSGITIRRKVIPL